LDQNCVDQIVHESNSNNFTKAIVNSLIKSGVLNRELSKKLLCFGIDRMNVFQGGKTGVIKQIKDSWAPFSMNVHCVAPHTNLEVQSLGNLTFIAKIEIFMLNMYDISRIH